MKKLLLLVSIMSFLFTVQAGYIIRGINSLGKPYNLKNYTLTVDNNGPVSAASMYSPLGGSSYGRNSIVIIPADNLLPSAYFPLSFPGGAYESFDISVRDFHYSQNNNTLYYVDHAKQLLILTLLLQL